MLNYIKSEFYRILHGKAIYAVTLVLTALTIVLNATLCGFGSMDGEFPYATAHYTFTSLIGSMYIFFYAALIIVSLLTSEESKNGTLKNVVAGGISRSQIFLGKCVVCGAMAFLSGAVVMTGFIVSAYLLLEWDASFALEVLLKGTAANLPASFAALILAVALYCIVQREMQVILLWLGVIVGIPMVSFFLGLKMEIFSKIAEWMPWNYLRYEVGFTFLENRIQALWMEPQGMARCLIAGSVGMVVFLLIGMIGIRKKDIS